MNIRVRPTIVYMVLAGTNWLAVATLAAVARVPMAEVIFSGPVGSGCNTTVVFLVDESGSIGEAKPHIMQQVRTIRSL